MTKSGYEKRKRNVFKMLVSYRTTWVASNSSRH